MITTFDGPSWSMRAVWLFCRLRGRAFGGEAAFRRRLAGRPAPRPAAPTRGLRARCEVALATRGGHGVYTVTPRAGGRDLRILYLHGGGYVDAPLVPHWWIVDALVAATGAAVTMPLYPLAPRHTHRDAFPWLEALYRDVRAGAGRVVLAGDSAGGGLALGLAMALRDAGAPAPDGLTLFSPWLDVTVADPAARAYERSDALLAPPALRVAGAWWAGEDDPRTPRVSPLYGEAAGLPPIDVFQSADEILAPDVRTFARRVAAAGGEMRVFEYPGAIHDLVGATFTPEARDAYARIAAGLRR